MTCCSASLPKCYAMDCTWTFVQGCCWRLLPICFINNHMLQWATRTRCIGLVMQLCKPPVIASVLMLLEVFECSDLLGLVLQKGDSSICLSDLPTYTEMTEHQLSETKTTQKWWTREMFDRLQNMARVEIMNLPQAFSFTWNRICLREFWINSILPFHSWHHF